MGFRTVEMVKGTALPGKFFLLNPTALFLFSPLNMLDANSLIVLAASQSIEGLLQSLSRQSANCAENIGYIPEPEHLQLLAHQI